MPSIFIWKSTTPNTSHKQIKYYTGSNWFLEDNESSSKSYMYLEQMVITGFDDSVITFNVKLMPQDWVGSELLEVTNIPYQHIKSDTYGTLEKVGVWMRFTSNNDVQFNSEDLQSELSKIQKWMNNTQKYNTTTEEYTKQYSNTHLYTQEKHNRQYRGNDRNNRYDMNKYNKSRPDIINYSNTNLNTSKIQTDFQAFLGQYNINNVLHA